MASPTDLTQHIQGLLDRRQEHAAAIEAIDETLAKIAGVLSVNGRGRRPGRPRLGRPPMGLRLGGKGLGGKGLGGFKRKRTRRKFAVSGEQSILNFVKSESNPIGREVEMHWAKEGRAGTAANLLSKLVKEKRLKRSPLKDQRGSRYSIA
jgi:hypothetical protein